MRRGASALLSGVLATVGCAPAATFTIKDSVPAEYTLDVLPRSAPVQARQLGLTPVDLPPPGQCRIWVSATPRGSQEGPGDCLELAERVPVGSWLVHRSPHDPTRVDLKFYPALDQPMRPIFARVESDRD
jgi:hypothetical protein